MQNDQRYQQLVALANSRAGGSHPQQPGMPPGPPSQPGGSYPMQPGAWHNVSPAQMQSGGQQQMMGGGGPRPGHGMMGQQHPNMPLMRGGQGPPGHMGGQTHMQQYGQRMPSNHMQQQGFQPGIPGQPGGNPPQHMMQQGHQSMTPGQPQQPHMMSQNSQYSMHSQGIMPPQQHGPHGPGMLHQQGSSSSLSQPPMSGGIPAGHPPQQPGHPQQQMMSGQTPSYPKPMTAGAGGMQMSSQQQQPPQGMYNQNNMQQPQGYQPGHGMTGPGPQPMMSGPPGSIQQQQAIPGTMTKSDFIN